MFTYYHYTFKVDSKTAKDNEAVKICRLTRGIVRDVSLTFPRGCAGLVGVRIFRSTRQVVPQNPVEWIVTDGETVEAKIDVDLTQEPYELELWAYNEDEVFSHTIRARFTVEVVLSQAQIITPQQESLQLIELLGLES
jgi:hypothetical protein